MDINNVLQQHGLGSNKFDPMKFKRTESYIDFNTTFTYSSWNPVTFDWVNKRIAVIGGTTTAPTLNIYNFSFSLLKSIALTTAFSGQGFGYIDSIILDGDVCYLASSNSTPNYSMWKVTWNLTTPTMNWRTQQAYALNGGIGSVHQKMYLTQDKQFIIPFQSTLKRINTTTGVIEDSSKWYTLSDSAAPSIMVEDATHFWVGTYAGGSIYEVRLHKIDKATMTGTSFLVATSSGYYISGLQICNGYIVTSTWQGGSATIRLHSYTTPTTVHDSFSVIGYYGFLPQLIGKVIFAKLWGNLSTITIDTTNNKLMIVTIGTTNGANHNIFGMGDGKYREIYSTYANGSTQTVLRKWTVSF